MRQLKCTRLQYPTVLLSDEADRRVPGRKSRIELAKSQRQENPEYRVIPGRKIEILRGLPLVILLRSHFAGTDLCEAGQVMAKEGKEYPEPAKNPGLFVGLTHLKTDCDRLNHYYCAYL